MVPAVLPGKSRRSDASSGRGAEPTRAQRIQGIGAGATRPHDEKPAGQREILLEVNDLIQVTEPGVEDEGSHTQKAERAAAAIRVCHPTMIMSPAPSSSAIAAGSNCAGMP